MLLNVNQAEKILFNLPALYDFMATQNSLEKQCLFLNLFFTVSVVMSSSFLTPWDGVDQVSTQWTPTGMF